MASAGQDKNEDFQLPPGLSGLEDRRPEARKGQAKADDDDGDDVRPPRRDPAEVPTGSLSERIGAARGGA